jgi:hypothetical protein
MLTLTAVKLGLRDLLDKRRADLRLSKSGRFYEASLEEQSAAIDALPPVLTGGTPLAAEIDTKDAEHDGYGAAIYFTTEVYLRLPDVDPEIAAAALRIRLAFIPALAELTASYAIEAERAMERMPLLASMAADLERFPVAGGVSLLGVATSFLRAGEQLHHLISERADVPKASRKEAAALRPATIGILNRLRADLTREIKKDPSLPRDLEQRVFGYFDTLETMHAAAKSAKPADAEAAEPTPKPEP